MIINENQNVLFDDIPKLSILDKSTLMETIYETAKARTSLCYGLSCSPTYHLDLTNNSEGLV